MAVAPLGDGNRGGSPAPGSVKAPPWPWPMPSPWLLPWLWPCLGLPAVAPTVVVVGGGGGGQEDDDQVEAPSSCPSAPPLSYSSSGR